MFISAVFQIRWVDGNNTFIQGLYKHTLTYDMNTRKNAIQSSRSSACFHDQTFICFSIDRLGSGPYRAIIHIQLRTTWWHQRGRAILKNDSSPGVTTVSSKYKCWDGKLSAHTSRLGLYGSATAARDWEQQSYLLAVRSAEAGKEEDLDTSQVSLAHFRGTTQQSKRVYLLCVFVVLLCHIWLVLLCVIDIYSGRFFLTAWRSVCMFSSVKLQKFKMLLRWNYSFCFQSRLTCFQLFEELATDQNEIKLN